MCCGRLLADADIEGVAAEDPSVHIDLPATPTAARVARDFVDQHAEGLGPEARDAAALCASELVTNGVLHARTPLVLGVTVGAERVLVTVADLADGDPHPPPPDHERTSGRGLVLVDAMASQWGVHHGDVGKTAWFTVPRGLS